MNQRGETKAAFGPGKTYGALALFSGGLDSILAARMVMAQDIPVLGLHFLSPFFGHPRRLGFWRKEYGVEVTAVDVSQEYVDMLVDGPSFGFGKDLNPCVDCKILMLRRAKILMEKYGAGFLLSGEVVGQRPMSQRRDALAAITRDAGVRDLLVRPLCAKHLDPTPPEENGLVDRERLGDFGGRGRKNQIAMAREMGITEIPTPAGGCLLTESESAKRYWPLLDRYGSRDPRDYRLANEGRQVWAKDLLLTTGRNHRTNDRLQPLALDKDLVLKLRDFPGPLGVGRAFGQGEWTPETVQCAAAHVASFSPKAVKAADQTGEPVVIAVESRGEKTEVSVDPDRDTPLGWAEISKADFKAWRKEKARVKAQARQKNSKEQGG